MKSKWKKLAGLSIAILLAMVLVTACAGEPPPDEDRIIVDVRAAMQGILPPNQNIDEIEIVEYETDDEAGLHEVLVRIRSNNQEVSFLEYYGLLYQRDEEGAWGLVGHQPTRTNLWTMTPLAGVDESEFRSAIMGMHLSIEGDDWNINEQSLDRITVSSRNTELEQNRDSVIVDVALSSLALSANGQIEIDFVFSDRWINDGHRISSPFTSEFLPHAVLDMTDERVLDKLTGMQQFVFSSGATAQDVHLNREQMLNISLVNSTTSSMGTHKTFEHTLDLEKELVSFEIVANSIYNFDGNSWSLDNIHITPRVTDVRLDGTTWGGIYYHRGRFNRILGGYNGPTQRQFTLEISHLQAVGGLRATLTELSPPIYSQYLFGDAVDFENLRLRLNFEEWIVEPTWTARGREQEFINRDSAVTFIGFINVEDSTIINLGAAVRVGENVLQTMTRLEALPPAEAADNGEDDEENGDD